MQSGRGTDATVCLPGEVQCRVLWAARTVRQIDLFLAIVGIRVIHGEKRGGASSRPFPSVKHQVPMTCLYKIRDLLLSDCVLRRTSTTHLGVNTGTVLKPHANSVYSVLYIVQTRTVLVSTEHPLFLYRSPDK